MLEQADPWDGEPGSMIAEIQLISYYEIQCNTRSVI